MSSSVRSHTEAKNINKAGDFLERIKALHIEHTITTESKEEKIQETYGDLLHRFEKEKKEILNTLKKNPQSLNPVELAGIENNYNIKETSHGKYAAFGSYHDYCENGIAEIKGIRYAQQEDSVIKRQFHDIHHLTSTERNTLFENTFKDMQTKHGMKNTGSTACITAAWHEDSRIKYCTANVGDSTSFLIVVNENGIPIHANITHPVHEQRFKLLGLNRAIGDNQYLEGEQAETAVTVNGSKTKTTVIFSHKPDINEGEVKLAPGDRAFIITACDGLTERMPPNIDEQANSIANCVSAYVTTKKDCESEIAFRLLEMALTGKNATGKKKWECSTDNISIIVTEIKPNHKPMLSAVFDGHGGNDVSKPLGLNTFSYLTNHYEKLLERPFKQLLISCAMYQNALMQSLQQSMDEKKRAELKVCHERIQQITQTIIATDQSYEEKMASLGDIVDQVAAINNILESKPATKPTLDDFNRLWHLYQVLLSPGEEYEKIDAFEALLAEKTFSDAIKPQGFFGRLFDAAKTPKELFFEETQHTLAQYHTAEVTPIKLDAKKS